MARIAQPRSDELGFELTTLAPEPKLTAAALPLPLSLCSDRSFQLLPHEHLVWGSLGPLLAQVGRWRQGGELETRQDLNRQRQSASQPEVQDPIPRPRAPPPGSGSDHRIRGVSLGNNNVDCVWSHRSQIPKEGSDKGWAGVPDQGSGPPAGQGLEAEGKASTHQGKMVSNGARRRSARHGQNP